MKSTFVRFALVPGGAAPVRQQNSNIGLPIPNVGFDLLARAVVEHEMDPILPFMRKTISDLSKGAVLSLNPGIWVTLGLGIVVEIPIGFTGYVEPRSSAIWREGGECRLEIVNQAVPIDSGFRGEIIVEVLNHGPGVCEINNQIRICQLVIRKVFVGGLSEVPFNELSKTTREFDCNGSTG
jgi:dUTP pyrophosphatase